MLYTHYYCIVHFHMVVCTLLSLSVHVQDGQEVASEGEEEISLDTLRQQADNVSIFPFSFSFDVPHIR